MSFLAPKPKAPEVPKVPTRKENTADLAAAAEDEKQRRKTQKGRATTLLTGGQGVMGDDSSGLATKKLLGGG